MKNIEENFPELHLHSWKQRFLIVPWRTFHLSIPQKGLHSEQKTYLDHLKVFQTKKMVILRK